MLNDHERKTLGEVERQFQVEDPEFTCSFDTRAQRLGRRHLDEAWFQIAMVAAMLLGALMLVAGSPSGALAFAAVAGPDLVDPATVERRPRTVRCDNGTRT